MYQRIRAPRLIARRPLTSVSPSRRRERALAPRAAAAASRGRATASSSREILGGSRVHFEMLYEAYFPRVYRFALKRLRDAAEAEDVTQEVFVTVFRALRSYQGDSSLLVWIFGITRNKVNRRFRGARPRMESIDADALKRGRERGARRPRRCDARRILLAQCEDAIEHRLTPLQRRIFHLKHLRRQSIRSIAERARQIRGRDQGQPLPHAPRDRAGAPGLEQVLRA